MKTFNAGYIPTVADYIGKIKTKKGEKLIPFDIDRLVEMNKYPEEIKLGYIRQFFRVAKIPGKEIPEFLSRIKNNEMKKLIAKFLNSGKQRK